MSQNPEADLRALWTAAGVPAEEQSRIIEAIIAKAIQPTRVFVRRANWHEQEARA
jgi:hypothetical protein